MALSKIQTLVQKIAETEKVKQVISEVQTVTQDLQTKIQKLSADEAVKKYKELAQKIVNAENELQAEVSKVVSQVKKTADDVEKNLALYKSKAEAQRKKIEKLILKKSAQFSKKKVVKTTATPKAKATTKKKVATKKKTAKKNK